MTLLTDSVRDLAASLDTDRLPAYIYDLDHLREHVSAVRDALPQELGLYYAAKANPEPHLLRVVAEAVNGFDVSSGGELEHVRACVPDLPLAFSGPGKSAAELCRALAANVDRVHAESLHELDLLDTLARQPVDVLLRVNVTVPDGVLTGSALCMGGSPSPFGLDTAQADEAMQRAAAQRYSHVRIRGVHAHLASGLDAGPQVDVAKRVLGWAQQLFARHSTPLREVNLGGGMKVDYADPAARFDWAAYGEGIHGVIQSNPGITLRIEPGRALTAFSGWYATDVLDVKHSHGRDFAVVRGGTHHLRTPATKGHDQPCEVLPVTEWPNPWARPQATQERVDLAGQLCTPKDILARGVRVPDGLRAGDRVVFAMAGAYAWNISHHAFLMHAHPSFHFIEDEGSDTDVSGRPSSTRPHVGSSGPRC